MQNLSESKMREYLERRGRTRLQVLDLLLTIDKNNYIPVYELERLYLEIYDQKLEPWYLWILHRDEFIEFKNIKFEDWEMSGKTTPYRVPIIKSPKSQVYHSDSVRIVPSKYDLIKSLSEFIKMRITEKMVKKSKSFY